MNPAQSYITLALVVLAIIAFFVLFVHNTNRVLSSPPYRSCIRIHPGKVVFGTYPQATQRRLTKYQYKVVAVKCYGVVNVPRYLDATTNMA